MNNINLKFGLLFFNLLLAQVFLFNNINLLGHINPYIYLIFIILLPVKGNRSLLIFLGFSLGLLIDIFENTGGIHAAASVFIAYIRPLVLKFSFSHSSEYQTLKFSATPLSSRLLYITVLVLIHHFVLNSLEVFNISQILLILKTTLISGLFSILLISLLSILFSKKVV